MPVHDATPIESAKTQATTERAHQPGVRRALPAYALLLVTSASFLGLSILNAGNTLHHNGLWVSGKVELAHGAVSAVTTLVTRPTLRRNRLDLGAYSGFQQFLHNAGRSVRELSFRFRSDEPAHLDVLYGPGPDRLSGVRVSGDPEFESLHYRLAPSGKFQARELLTGWTLPHGSWVPARFAFSEEAVSVFIGEADPIRLTSPASAVRSVGFRGGLESVLVDDVRLTFADGSEPFVEAFSSHASLTPWLLAIGAALALLTWIGHALLRRCIGLEPPAAHLACLTAHVVILVGVLAFFLVDFLHLAGRYPADPALLEFAGYDNRIESAEDVLRRLRAVAAEPDDGRVRILVVGSSQTAGAGARRTEDAIAPTLERRLEAADPAGRRFRVINASVSGALSDGLFSSHRREWIRLRPEIVVINLSSNDRDMPLFLKSLEQFVTLNRVNRIDTLFVLEPNCPESSEPIAPQHEVMRAVAAAHEISVVDMHRTLKAHRQEGFLWWDYVHLTSYGQARFAEILAPEILSRVPAR